MKILSIIVTFNGMKWIDKCLQSLKTSTVLVDVMVVDNASSDGVAAYIEANFPTIILYKSKINVGFGQANNIGFQYAIHHGYDAVLLLNQDAYLDSNAIAELLPLMQQQTQIGIWSPFHKSYDGIANELYFDKYVLQYYTPNYLKDLVKEKIEPFYVSNFIHAACWLMPIETVKKIGGFDPLFFQYGEDNDYIQRLHFHNLAIGFATTSIVYHHGSNNTMLAPEKTNQFWMNQSVLKLKHPKASTVGALVLFLKNGIIQLFSKNKEAKKAFKTNIKRIKTILISRKMQFQSLAYLKNNIV